MAKDDPKMFDAGGGMGTRLAEALLPESGIGTRRLYLRIIKKATEALEHWIALRQSVLQSLNGRFGNH